MAFFVKPVFIFLLILAQSYFEIMENPSSSRAEAARLTPIHNQELNLLMRQKEMMVLALDSFDGCGICYSDEDCKNNSGCGSYCSKSNAYVSIGICRKSGPLQE